jgi:hypothetical protein
VPRHSLWGSHNQQVCPSVQEAAHWFCFSSTKFVTSQMLAIVEQCWAQKWARRCSHSVTTTNPMP